MQRLVDVLGIHVTVGPTCDDARDTGQRVTNHVPGLESVDAAGALVPYVRASCGESQPKNTRLPTMRRNG